MNITED